MDVEVVVIGAGPHGLAAVAHLRRAGISVQAFGDPLGFWRETMPARMLLRSPARASNISDPSGELTLSRWAQKRGVALPDPVPIGDFISYGMWFQSVVAPDLDHRRVAEVRRAGACFETVLSDGSVVRSARVAVAAGLEPFAHVPQPFAATASAHVTHTAASPSLESFMGRSVAVIGSGQSALESAALLKDAGAAVELIARAPAILWLNFGWSGNGAQPPLPPLASSSSTAVGSGADAPSWRARHGLYWHAAPTEVGGTLVSWIVAAPDVMRRLPYGVRSPLSYRAIRPAGAHWLPDRVRDVKFTLGTTVTSIEERGERVRLVLASGEERSVDHVLLGTGYKVDVRRYPFLQGGLGEELEIVNGSPALSRGLESSVSGLHFLGATAAESFGGVMRFVVSTAYTAPAFAQYLRSRRRPLFRWAF